MKIQIIILILLNIVSTLSVASNFIQAQLSHCREIANESKRLDCYDLINNQDKKPEIVKTQLATTVFPPLLADIEEPRIYTSYGRMNFLDDNFNAILIGVGARKQVKTFALNSFENPVDFNIIAMIKSQFDVSELDTRNNRGGILINTDFMVGGELTKATKYGGLRLKYSHRSTHLGDEFILDNPIFAKSRLNLSYEALDLLAYRDINNWQVYLGGSFITRSEPGSLGKLQIQSGLQYQGDVHNWFSPIFALDLKSWEASDWHVNTSLKAGIELPTFLQTPIQILFEYQQGKSPYGQFINEDLEYLGLTISHYF